MQFARGMGTVGIVIADQQDILPLGENEVRDVHYGWGGLWARVVERRGREGELAGTG